MNRITYIQILIILCIIPILSSCYSIQMIPREDFYLDKRDKVIFVKKKDPAPEAIYIGMKRWGVDAAFISMDTLFVRVNHGSAGNPYIKEFRIPLSDIDVVEVLRYNRERTAYLAVGLGAGYMVLGILLFLILLWSFNI